MKVRPLRKPLKCTIFGESKTISRVLLDDDKGIVAFTVNNQQSIPVEKFYNLLKDAGKSRTIRKFKKLSKTHCFLVDISKTSYVTDCRRTTAGVDEFLVTGDKNFKTIDQFSPRHRPGLRRSYKEILRQAKIKKGTSNHEEHIRSVTGGGTFKKLDRI